MRILNSCIVASLKLSILGVLHSAAYLPYSTAIHAAWCFCSCELPCCNVECVLLYCFNAQPYISAVVNCIGVALSASNSPARFNTLPCIFAVMHCSVLALNAVFCSGLLTWTTDKSCSLVTHGATTTKENACRIICMLCQETSTKHWFANVNMTSYCDITDSVCPVTMTTICHCSILEIGMGHTIKQSIRPPPKVTNFPF